MAFLKGTKMFVLVFLSVSTSISGLDVFATGGLNGDYSEMPGNECYFACFKDAIHVHECHVIQTKLEDCEECLYKCVRRFPETRALHSLVQAMGAEAVRQVCAGEEPLNFKHAHECVLAKGRRELRDAALVLLHALEDHERLRGRWGAVCGFIRVFHGVLKEKAAACGLNDAQRTILLHMLHFSLTRQTGVRYHVPLEECVPDEMKGSVSIGHI